MTSGTHLPGLLPPATFRLEISTFSYLWARPKAVHSFLQSPPLTHPHVIALWSGSLSLICPVVRTCSAAQPHAYPFLPFISTDSVAGECPISLRILKGQGRWSHGSSFSPGLALSAEVHDLLESCELPDLPSTLLLPEDMALRSLPPLRAAHRRFNFDTDRPLLSTLEEVRTSFLRPQALLLVRHSSKVGTESRRGQGAGCGLFLVIEPLEPSFLGRVSCCGWCLLL